LTERMKAITVPNVVGLVGTRSAPETIPEEEIAWIRQGLEHGKAAPHEYLNAGEAVEITTGAMSGMKGILLRRNSGTRVVISLDSIARAFVVEVDASSVRPFHAKPAWDLPRPAAHSLASGPISSSNMPFPANSIETARARTIEIK
jgi:hypothetical protein